MTFAEARHTLLHSLFFPTSARALTDFFLNVLVYMPPGFVFALAVRWRWAWRIAGATLMGLAITISVELLQGFIVTRDQSLLDCIANTLGAGLGAATAWIAGHKYFDRMLSSAKRRVETDSVALLCVWLLSQWFPLFPSIGFYRLARKLEALVSSGMQSIPTVVAATEWIGVALIVERMAGAAAPRWMLLIMAALPLRLFIHLRQVTISEILGALLGVALWRWLLFHRKWKNWAGALILAGGVLVSELAPFQFVNRAAPFQWRPFASSLATTHWEQALIVLTAKGYRYAALVWVVRQCGPGYPVAGALVAMVLFTTEMTQRYLPGRSAEIADPLLALIMALLLWMVRKTAR